MFGINPAPGYFYHNIHICWFTTSLETSWGTVEIREMPKKEADKSRKAGGRYRKQGNSHMWLILGSHKTRFPFFFLSQEDFQLSLPNLQSLYRGLIWVLSHTQSRWPQYHTTFLWPWKASGMHMPKTGEVEACNCPGQLVVMSSWGPPLTALLQTPLQI